MKYSVLYILIVLIHGPIDCAALSPEEQEIQQALIQSHQPSKPRTTSAEPKEQPTEHTAPLLTREQMTIRAQEFLNNRFGKR